MHEKVNGKFTNAIMRGVELSIGQFVLIIDADFRYPYELVPNLINA